MTATLGVGMWRGGPGGTGFVAPVMKTARSFWSGAAAGAAFVIVALLARAVDAVPTVPELVQDRLILLLPGPIFSLLLDRFLYLGKPLFFVSLLIAQILLGVLAGAIIGRRILAPVMAVALWLVTGLVLLPLAGRGIFAESPAVAFVTLLGFAVYALVFILFDAGPKALRQWTTGPRSPVTSEPVALAHSHVDRRRLLAGGALGLASVVLARRAIGKLPALPPRGGAAASSDGVAQPQASSPAVGAVAGDVVTALPGLPPAVTPVDRFYIVSKNLLDPNVDAGKWRLQVDGLVSQPLVLGYSDLLAMPAVDAYRTLECISNEVGGDLISNGLWTGVRMADLLQHAGVRPEALMIHFTSADGFTANMPLQQAMDPATLLVYNLDGAPLPQKHGFPVRVLGTGTYGMKNAKWVTRMEVVTTGSPGFWQQQGWDEQGIVQTMAQIDTPTDGTRLPVGPAAIGGIAFAGARGIARVEASTDGGATWSDAQLLPPLGSNTWTFWQLPWQPAQPGSYTIVARATDGIGTVQTVRHTDPFPTGATGYHQLRVRVTA